MTANELRDILDSKYNGQIYNMTLADIAENHKMILSKRHAYNFDKIAERLSSDKKLSTADALYVGKRSILLIEFKTGFDIKKYINDDNKSFKEMLRKSLRLKACESLILLEKVFCDEQKTDFKKIYVSVIDGDNDPLGARSDTLDDISNRNESISEKQQIERELREKSVLLYRKEFGKKHIMYDQVEVMYDSVFDSEIEKLVK